MNCCICRYWYSYRYCLNKKTLKLLQKTGGEKSKEPTNRKTPKLL